MLIPLCYRYLSMDKIYLFQLGKNIEKKPLLLVNNIKFNLINIFKNLIFFLDTNTWYNILISINNSYIDVYIDYKYTVNK